MLEKSKNIKALIFWEGFPACGLLVKRVLDTYTNDVILVATKASVPFKGLEKKLGHDIIWLESPNHIWQKRLDFSDRNLVIHTGWNHKKWLKFDKFIKKKNCAKIVLVSDNKYTGSIRQFLGSIYFRIKLRKIFDAAFVPGKSGTRLMKYFGVPANKIFTGNYGAHESLFHLTKEFNKRKNEFLYVGQLNYRKSTDILIEAFKLYKKKGGKWNLRILGSGPLESICHGDGILNEGFTQPHEVSSFMNSSKVLILISRHDNWGTVVCEAAACGMNLLLSKNVGASEDILEDSINGKFLNNLTVNEVCNLLFYFERMPSHKIDFGSKRSLTIASSYGSDNYFNSYKEIVQKLGFNDSI
ncbi:glycosyltransferase [Gammaproteobacteria bacterium]|nr:glycosyltransferase [Gammaproteobacteria bacterium]MDC0511108.1 glycosyltransferase [bacterium]